MSHTPGPWSHDGIDCVFAVVPQCCNKPIQHPNFDAGGNPTTVAYEECCGSPEAERIPVASCGTNDLPIITAAPLMLEALKVHQEWTDKERAGPQYPAGVSRDNGGENIWRAWWEDQLHLCDKADRLTRAAIAKAEAA